MKRKLTKPQREFLKLHCRYPLFIGGYGSGKSYALETALFRDLSQYPGANIGIYCPTYDLLTLNLIPRFEEFLNLLGIRYTYLKSKNVIVIPYIGNLIMRSMDNPSRIVAYEVFRSHVDEMDLMPMDKAEEVWNRIIARNRQKLPGSPQNRVYAYSTPEGFAFTYNRWGKGGNPEYQYVRAPTWSNPHLASDYIESLKSTYSEQLIEAYLKGIWVNLTSGACFPEFDRQLNWCDTVPRQGERLYVGQDFNITKQASVIYVQRHGKELHAVDEVFNAFDTEDTIKQLKFRYPEHPIEIIPDASGKNRSSTSGSISDFTLLQAAGYRLNAPSKNPGVQNRINAANAFICNARKERRLKVNVEKCPEFTSGLEQITFDQAGNIDKKNELNHICFSGDTLVDVNHQILPFNAIPNKGVVKNLAGEWIPYHSAGVIGMQSDILCLQFSTGDSIRCTPEHEFLTTKGWIQARDLKGLMLLNSDLMVSLGICKATITQEKESGCIELYMNDGMEKFLKAIISIIKIMIDQIISLKIWNCYRPVNIRDFIVSPDQNLLKEDFMRQVLKQHQNGIGVLKVENGIVSTCLELDISLLNRFLSFVNNVVSSLKRNGKVMEAQKLEYVLITAMRLIEDNQGLITRSAIANTVVKNLKLINTKKQNIVRVDAVQRLNGKENAYCLTTHEGCFSLANGMIVSNCDAGTYPIHRLYPVEHYHEQTIKLVGG